MTKPTITLPAFGAAIAGQGGIFAAIMRGHIVDGVEQAPYALLVSDAAAGEIENVTWGEDGKEVTGTDRDGTEGWFKGSAFLVRQQHQIYFRSSVARR